MIPTKGATQALLSFQDVSFHYRQETPVFSGVSFDIQPGAFCLVRGPSGSGKSTLLRLLNRMEEPSSGQILYKGLPLSSYFPPLLRRKILYIQQTPSVVDGSIRENLLLPFGFKHNRALPRPDDSHLKSLLKDFMLNSVRLEDHAQTLSVGQLQRICFIRGLLLSPEILALDEPTSALDRESAGVVEAETEKRCREGLAVMMISHTDYVPRTVKPINLRLTGGRVENNTLDVHPDHPQDPSHDRENNDPRPEFPAKGR